MNRRFVIVVPLLSTFLAMSLSALAQAGRRQWAHVIAATESRSEETLAPKANPGSFLRAYLVRCAAKPRRNVHHAQPIKAVSELISSAQRLWFRGGISRRLHLILSCS